MWCLITGYGIRQCLQTLKRLVVLELFRGNFEELNSIQIRANANRTRTFDVTYYFLLQYYTSKQRFPINPEFLFVN